jgi:hypothetical protein
MIAQRLSRRIQQISQLRIREEAATAGGSRSCGSGEDTAGGVCKPWRGREGRGKHSGGGGKAARHCIWEGGQGCRGLLSGRGDIILLI